MKKMILMLAVFLFYPILNSFAINELQGMDVAPEFSILNSSALASDTPSLLLNPAGLYRVDRITAMVSTPNLQTIGFLGSSIVIPGTGSAVGLGVYNLSSTNGSSKQGITAGIGKDFFEVLALGVSLKTVSSSMSDLSDGLLFNAGFIFHPNDSMGSIFKNSMLNNKLFISAAIQNLGKNTSSAAVEEMTLRTGIAYDISPIWTRAFVDGILLNQNPGADIGLEIHPSIPFWNSFSLRASTDLKALKIGFAITGEDAHIDLSYNPSGNQVYMSLTGYFEKTRIDLSRQYYDDGNATYQDAVDLEKQKDDTAFDKYHQALDSFNTALSYDKGNNKAAIRKSEIEDKFNSYKSDFIAKGQAAESKSNYTAALISYNRADAIDDTPEIRAKIQTLSTNSAVLSYVKTKKANIVSLMTAKKYLSARKESDTLLSILPNDSDVQAKNNEIKNQLRSVTLYYYQKALNLYKKELYEDAIAQANISLINDPTFDKARDIIRLSNAELNTQKGVDNASLQYKAKNYLSALKMVNYILAKDANNKDAANLKTRIMQSLKDTQKANLDRGIQYYNASDYDNAVNEFDKVLAVDPTNSIAGDYRSRAVAKTSAIEKLSQLEGE